MGNDISDIALIQNGLGADLADDFAMKVCNQTFLIGIDDKALNGLAVPWMDNGALFQFHDVFDIGQISGSDHQIRISHSS